MQKKLWIALALTLITLAPARATAAEATFFSARLGYPSMKVAIDPRNEVSPLAAMAIGLEAFKTFSNLPIAVGVFSQIYMGGSLGGLPLIQAGVSIYYFPFARLESSYEVNDEVTVHTSAWSPYLKLQPGFMFANFNNADKGAVFGSSSLMYILSAGLMMPLSEKMRWGGEIGWTSSLGAKDERSNPISISGVVVSGHITFFLP